MPKAPNCPQTREPLPSALDGVMGSHTSVWLRSEDPAFGALPQLKCNPKTFRGERRWLHSAFFLSFFPHFHTPKLWHGPLSRGYGLPCFGVAP